MKLLYSFFFFFLSFTAVAQKLSMEEVHQIAQSLLQQKIITATGKDELIRYAEKKTLKIYDGYTDSTLDEINCSQYIMDIIYDMLPGRENKNKKYFNALLNQDTTGAEGSLANEEIFLNKNFPTRSKLFDFLYTAATFYLYEGFQNYTSTSTTLSKQFGNYFDTGMYKIFKDSTVEANMSYEGDSAKEHYEMLIAAVQPYLKWVGIFKQSGLLKNTDNRIEKRYTNGTEIYSPVNNLSIFKEIKELITYQDKFFCYKKRQLSLLDSLAGMGFINTTAMQTLIEDYSNDTLLTIENIIPLTKQYIQLDDKTELAPYNVDALDDYGTIDVNSLKKVYENILQKAAKLLHFTFKDLSVHKIDYGNKDELIPFKSNRQYYVHVTINGILYKEMVKEHDGENWIMANNFQLLNHFLEDTHDERRAYFGKQELFTTYESQQSATIFICFLKQKEAAIFNNKYMTSSLEACYNGSLGDYDYSVYDYYSVQDTDSTEYRLSRSSIIKFIDLCMVQNIIKPLIGFKKQKLIAAIREKNPQTAANILYELPNTFKIDEEQPIESLLLGMNSLLQQLQNTQQQFFTSISDKNKLVKDSLNQKIWVYQLNFKTGINQHHLSTKSKSDLWQNNLLLNTLNKALTKAGCLFNIYPIFIGEMSGPQGLHGNLYCMLKPIQEKVLQKMYPIIFKK